MDRVVFFGKGGIGKSTTSSCMSAIYAAEGERVLHVGCDPKHDSTVSLLGGQMIEPVVDKIRTLHGVKPEDIVVRSPFGVDCVEAGGPEAGVGCGGRGISRMLEIFEAAKLLAPGSYDVAVYDVLGDVVCGGFASPLRKGIGEKVVIVTSEEVMSLYAANNIARAVVHYADNGVKLAGLLVNQRDNAEDTRPVERFAEVIGTRILGYVPRDSLFREAEYLRTNVVGHAPGSPLVARLRKIARAIREIDASTLQLPKPLSEKSFYEYAQRRFEGGPNVEVEPAAAATAKQALLPLSKLAPPNAAQDAANRKLSYEKELRAGMRAVRLGKVNADEALRRLVVAFPKEAASLLVQDLTSLEETP